MTTIHSTSIETVKDKIAAAIKGTGNALQATVDTVAELLSTTLKDTKVGMSVTDAIADITTGAIRGSVQAGADLGQATHGTMLGVLNGSRETGTMVLDTISRTSQVAIREAAEFGGDLELAATGLVKGAIDGARKMGVSAEEAAAAAADGALKAAAQVGTMTVETVRKAMRKPISGVVVLKESEIAAV